MPGAPPYPPHVEHPPPPVGQRRGTRFVTALGAAAVWAAVLVVLVLAFSGPPPSSRAAGALLGSLLVSSLVSALVVWAVARRRTWPFWRLVLLAAPVFLLLRLISQLGS
jgi:hypothetical protein